MYDLFLAVWTAEISAATLGSKRKLSRAVNGIQWASYRHLVL